jgi:predicted outer membrane lipoprotein
MLRRTFAWILVVPVAAAGLLATHALAYELTGASVGRVHGYLAHAPQVVGLLATLSLVGLALQQRSVGRLSAWSFSLLAPLGFACQEHLERLVHTGELPWLLTSPPFLLGLALQVPVALVCVLVARRVAGVLVGVRRERPGTPGGAWLPLTARPAARPRVARRLRPVGRAPPDLLAS